MRVFILPSDVNFGKITIREDTAIGIGEGYYSYLDGDVHMVSSEPVGYGFTC